LRSSTGEANTAFTIPIVQNKKARKRKEEGMVKMEDEEESQ
jgi:hypothetical protein